MSPVEFAVWIVRELQAAGHQALFAGGCVRDQLLGQTPKDYDVATSAIPEQVRALFGPRRTIPVGAAFGVITVIGSKASGNVEVATFRSDGKYSDGRHPDQVTFSDPEHDAQRRDFTINGLFYDPIRGEVQDYVGGQSDLQQGIVRAIRDPRERFQEDHLRMLRAIRFATVLNFELDNDTLVAIQRLAEEIRTVSGERIAAELRRLLESPHRGRGLQLLRDSGLMAVLFPPLPDGSPGSYHGGELTAPEPAEEHPERHRQPAEDFDRACQRLSELPRQREGLEVAFAVLTLTEWLGRATAGPRHLPCEWWGTSEAVSVLRGYAARVQAVVQAWRLSNESKTIFKTIQQSLPVLAMARDLPWSRLQPVLLLPRIDVALDVAQVLAASGWMESASIARCRECLSWPTERLNPPPLLTGDQLREAGMSAGPELGRVLAELRQRQLDGQLSDSVAARDWVQDQMR